MTGEMMTSKSKKRLATKAQTIEDIWESVSHVRSAELNPPASRVARSGVALERGARCSVVGESRRVVYRARAKKASLVRGCAHRYIYIYIYSLSHKRGRERERGRERV